MDLQELKDLQEYLIGSHQWAGKYGRPMLQYMNRPSRFRTPEIDPNDLAEFSKNLAQTFVLAHYIQHRYGVEEFSDPYQKQDQLLMQLLSDIQGHLQNLASKTKEEYPELDWSRLDQMLTDPMRYYDKVPPCKRAEEKLDSLVRFRDQYPVPFDQLEPENIRHLYQLYSDVAKTKEVDEEKLQWLIWATEAFHPLSNNAKVDEAKQQKNVVHEMYYKATAFLQLIDNAETFPTHHPPEVQRTLRNCANTVYLFLDNMGRYDLLPPKENKPDHINQEKEWLEQRPSQSSKPLPRQLALFEKPQPPSVKDQPKEVIQRPSDRTR